MQFGWNGLRKRLHQDENCQTIHAKRPLRKHTRGGDPSTLVSVVPVWSLRAVPSLTSSGGCAGELLARVFAQDHPLSLLLDRSVLLLQQHELEVLGKDVVTSCRTAGRHWRNGTRVVQSKCNKGIEHASSNQKCNKQMPTEQNSLLVYSTQWVDMQGVLHGPHSTQRWRTVASETLLM